jgi:hypothetical protein
MGFRVVECEIISVHSSIKLARLRVISALRCDVCLNCVILGVETASSGNFLPTFRD